MSHRAPRSSRQVLLTGLVLLFALPALAQGVDVEPNNTCSTAQEMGTVSLPFTVDGELEPAPDVDFFLVTGEADERVQIDLAGSATGQGTLEDPLLGAFDGSCNPLGVDDEGGFGGDARLVLDIPADGRLILAATSFSDFAFLGGGPGSYRLTVSDFQTIGSISGRIVDGDTGDPLPGVDWPYTQVHLFQCGDPACEVLDNVGTHSPDLDGRFSFTSLPSGEPLIVGTYKVHVGSQGYEFFIGDPFEVFADEDFDMGDLPMTPLSLIGTVGGRLVDAVSGLPLSGTAPPFASAVLERCFDFGCLFAAQATVDDDGRFQVLGPRWQLAPGRYRVQASAEQYVARAGTEFDVGERQSLDVGDFALEPVAVQVIESTSCSDLPSTGGTCAFSVRVHNASRGRVSGAAWADVWAATEFPFFLFHHFQVGMNGTVNPMAQKFNLAPRQVATFGFSFDVPDSVEDGALICGAVNLGKNPSPHLDLLGSRFVFCISKVGGVLTVLGEKEGHKKLRAVTDRKVR